MGGKKKKYNARFPPARIKKIMQTDEEVGKIAAPVPVVISRALELFLESLITKSVGKANGQNAKTLTSSHIKSVIHSYQPFDFLKSQVALVPDLQADGEGTSADDSAASSLQSPTAVPAAQPPKKKPRASSTVSSSAAASGTSAAGSTEQKEVKTKKHKPAFSVNDEDKPPKRKRGRPAKVKVVEESIKEATPSPPIISAFRKVSSNSSLNGLATPPVKEEPAAEPTPPQPQTRLTDTAQHLTSAAGVLADSPQPESIFSTDTTLLSNSSLSSTAAHTNSLVLRYPTGHSNLGLQLPAGSTDISNIYKTLSPTSQPMDLSTKPLNIQGLSQHTTTTNTLPGHNSAGASTQPPPPLYRQHPVTLPTGNGSHVEDDDDDYDV